MPLNMLIEFGDAFDYFGTDFAGWRGVVGFRDFKVFRGQLTPAFLLRRTAVDDGLQDATPEANGGYEIPRTTFIDPLLDLVAGHESEGNRIGHGLKRPSVIDRGANLSCGRGCPHL